MLFQSILSVLATALISMRSAQALPNIDIVGNKFFYSNNGSQFYIKGVAYQQDVSNSTTSSFDDPLANAEACARDIPYLQQLSTNVVRVYAVNASLDHDSCMQLLDDAGIYVIADLAEPTLAIDTTNPEWTLELYNRYTTVIDMFSDYSNVLGFFAGNEVVTNSSTSSAAPFVKAAIRDMKQYMVDQGYRSIPIGYSANDDADSRVFSADYFACGDEDVHADFYGINMYEWCGSSSFRTSGYADRTEEFGNLTIPVFFSEYGCNRVQPRRFSEVLALYSDEMTDVWSGGIVYMYFQETNHYGLVSVNDDGDVSTLADFGYLSSALASVTPTSATSADVTAQTDSLFACPATNADWSAVTSLPPTPNDQVCDCVDSSLTCVVDDDVDSEDYADLFAYICGVISCDDVNANGTSGNYGDYSFCSDKTKLNYMLNLYYEHENRLDYACSFDGSASINSHATTASSCSSILTGASPLAVSTTRSRTRTTSTAEDDASSESETETESSASSAASESSSSSSSASGASSIYSRKFSSGFSDLSVAIMTSAAIFVGVCVAL